MGGQCVCAVMRRSRIACLFFFNDPATTEIYTLPLHDALPISAFSRRFATASRKYCCRSCRSAERASPACRRSEEHTSELQSHLNLVCRLLLEKKKKKHIVCLLLPQPPRITFSEA